MLTTSALAKIGVAGALLLIAGASKAQTPAARRTGMQADSLAGYGLNPSNVATSIFGLQAGKGSLYAHGDPDNNKQMGGAVINGILGYYTAGIYTAINKGMTSLGAPDGGIMTMDNLQNDGTAVADSWNANTKPQYAIDHPEKIDVVANLDRSVATNIVSNVQSVFRGLGF